MSYDIDVAGHEHNYTYNLAQFFNDFGVSPRTWDGVSRYKVADQIDVALARIELDDIDDLHEKYDPDNGWGDVESAIGFLRSVRDSCRTKLDNKVHVY